MNYIGKFNIEKVDGSVTYTELDIFQGETTETEVILKTVEMGYHNGGHTERRTEKWYPISFLNAITGGYNKENGLPVVDTEVLGGILQQFGITLQA